MNELDKRIAELKGLTVDGLGGLSTDKPGVFTLGPTWSTSDTKALELVDEILDRGGVDFQLVRPEKKSKPWSATFGITDARGPVGFITDKGARFCHLKSGEGPTRPEAICRAYIAAMGWMREKKG